MLSWQTNCGISAAYTRGQNNLQNHVDRHKKSRQNNCQNFAWINVDNFVDKIMHNYCFMIKHQLKDMILSA